MNNIFLLPMSFDSKKKKDFLFQSELIVSVYLPTFENVTINNNGAFLKGI